MTLPYPRPLLTDGVVTLRAWANVDVAAVRAASADPYIPTITTVPGTYTEDAARAWIKCQLDRATNDEGLSLAITRGGTTPASGALVVLHSRPGVGTLGYWLVPSARGRRLASRAVRLLVAWALTEGRLARVEALVEPWNLASQRVLEAAGFVRDGLMRSHQPIRERRADVFLYFADRASLTN